MEPVIQVHALTRHFGAVRAVNGVSLTVARGEIFGFLGPNGAGKSTTIRLLAGIMEPDSGSGNILGFDLARDRESIKRHIGYVAQHFALYPELTVAENLGFYASLYGVGDPDVDRYLGEYGLTEFASRRAGTLSGGYKRRLSLACAMTHDPTLLFLDEPTAGIDPVTRKEIWDLFYGLATRGKTLFVTTHYMEEAERCHRLAFLNHGRIVVTGSPAEIRAQLDGLCVYAYRSAFDPDLVNRLRALPGVMLLNQFGNELRIVTERTLTAERLRQVLGNPDRQALRTATAGIEDAFMVLTA